jgi:hypothetical protein
MIKNVAFLYFILLSAVTYAQDSENADENSDHRIYLSVMGGGFHASKKSAAYYDGSGENSIDRVLSIPQIYDQIYNKIGYNFVLGSFPAAARYRIGVDLGLEAGFWMSEYTALTIGVDYLNLNVSETFTLEVENPANPFGDPLIYPEQIIAKEQRFQFNLGLHHDVGANEKMMTFFEWGLNFNALKPVKHEIIVEELLRYNLMYQLNYFTFTPKTYIGYGGFIGFGCRMRFQKSMALDFGLKAYLQKIKISDFQSFAFSELLFIRIVYL